MASIDDSEKVGDQEIIDMAHWICRTEGLFIGSSSALNLVAAIRTATNMPIGSHIITVVCDSGQRHLTRFWSQSYIEEFRCNKTKLVWPSSDTVPDCLKNYIT